MASVAAGAAVGATVGVALLGLEELANLVVDQPALAPQELLRLLPWYVGWPALLGVLASRAGDLPGRVLGTSAGVWGIVWGAIAAQELGERGVPMPSLVGFGLGAVAAVVGAVGVLRLVHCTRRRWGLAVASLVFLAPFRAVNLNAFGSPTEPAALTADAAIVALALVLGLVAVFARDWLMRPAVALGAALVPGLLALGGRLLLAPPPPSPAPAASHPDLVLVVVDTLRADHLGAYGHDRPTSPRLDAIAARGIVYTDATSPAPWTLPSFASLQTGREPHVHGAGVNPGDRNTQAPLGPDLPTVAERLSARGYRTGAIVTNPYLKASFGLDRGYDHYDDALGLAHMMMLLHPIDLLPVRAMPDRSYRLAPRMVAAADRWWQQTAGGPRFLMLHIMDPHKPYNAPAIDQQAVGTGRADPVEDLYDAEIHYLDRTVGPWLEQVLAEGATVLLTADHGEEFSDHPGAYPGEKWPPDVRHGHTLYQEQLHVPLIAAGPDVAAAVVDRPVRSLDVVPTLLALAGAPPVDTDGQPLAEVLGQPTPPPLPRRAQAIRYGSEKRAVLDQGRKLIRSRHGDELFDLDQDPAEQQDLAARRPDEVRALESELPGESEGQDAELDAALLEQLRAVGYVDE